MVIGWVWVPPTRCWAQCRTSTRLGCTSRYPLLAISRRAEGDRGDPPTTTGLLSNIRLYLADGTLYPHKGTYSYTKRDAGDQTGTIIIVASFPNPERLLKVGQSAVVMADVGSPEGVVLIPQQAVVQQLDRSGVWVVDKDGVVGFRTVSLGEKFGHYWIVEQGVRSGELVVTNGLQRLRGGEKVIAEKAHEKN